MDSGVTNEISVRESQTVSEVLQTVEHDLNWRLRIVPVTLATGSRILEPTERMSAIRGDPMDRILHVVPIKGMSIWWGQQQNDILIWQTLLWADPILLTKETFKRDIQKLAFRFYSVIWWIGHLWNFKFYYLYILLTRILLPCFLALFVVWVWHPDLFNAIQEISVALIKNVSSPRNSYYLILHCLYAALYYLAN